jgi:hypothetical protein
MVDEREERRVNIDRRTVRNIGIVAGALVIAGGTAMVVGAYKRTYSSADDLLIPVLVECSRNFRYEADKAKDLDEKARKIASARRTRKGLATMRLRSPEKRSEASTEHIQTALAYKESFEALYKYVSVSAKADNPRLKKSRDQVDSVWATFSKMAEGHTPSKIEGPVAEAVVAVKAAEAAEKASEPKPDPEPPTTPSGGGGGATAVAEAPEPVKVEAKVEAAEPVKEPVKEQQAEKPRTEAKPVAKAAPAAQQARRPAARRAG